MKISIILRKDKPNTDGLCPVMLKIRVDGRRLFETIREYIPVMAWNEDNKNNADWIKKGYPNAQLINLKIQNKINELQKRFLLDGIDGREITQELAQEKLQRNAGVNDFFKIADQFIADQKNDGTRNNYNYYTYELKTWYPGLKWRDFSVKWFEAYRAKLVRNEHNTIWAKFKFLHTVIALGIESGKLKENPFRGFNMPRYQQGLPQYLTQAEIAKWESFMAREGDQHGKMVLRAGTWFLFGIYTGLRYSDWRRVNWDKDIIQPGKIQRLVLDTLKTGEVVSIKIGDKLAAAIEKLKIIGPPELAKQTNLKLKEIAKLSKIGKSVSCHYSRHSFGMICAENGVPIEVTAKLMGHRKITTTEIYYHISNKNIDSWVDKING